MKQGNRLDFFRLIAATLVVAIHTSPFLSYSPLLDFAVTQIIGRVAVPFFWMISGYFLFGSVYGRLERERKTQRKLLTLYAVAVLLYLPVNWYAGYFKEALWPRKLLLDFLSTGSFYHLWYLPASILGIALTGFLLRRYGYEKAGAIALGLYLFGLLGDNYYGLTERADFLRIFYQTIFALLPYSRNGLFMTPIFLVMGADIARAGYGINRQKCLLMVLLSATLLLSEGLLLYFFGAARHTAMYLFLLPLMFFLFLLLVEKKQKRSRIAGDLSLLIYLLHPLMIVVLRGFAKVLKWEKLLIENSLIFFVGVMLLSLAASFLGLMIMRRVARKAGYDREKGNDGAFAAEKSAAWREESAKTMGKSGKAADTGRERTIWRKQPEEPERAWIELDLANLKNNVKALQARLAKEGELMAVVKANAYGHGADIIAPYLEDMGITAFAVATLEEGIALRRQGMQGEILILGYTSAQRAGELKKYRLTQTVVDADHARALEQAGYRIAVHIKIDSGMRRLGLTAEDTAGVAGLFASPCLQVRGIYTHLCVADSKKPEDIAYTCEQLERFGRLLTALKQRGIALPAVHFQSSYGLLNYSEKELLQLWAEECQQRSEEKNEKPMDMVNAFSATFPQEGRGAEEGRRLQGLIRQWEEMPPMYARVGIALYGCFSQVQEGALPELKPVLSLKSRIIHICNLQAGESAGYGRAFIAEKDCRLAVVPIGYADGLPRSLSGRGNVIIGGKKARIVGRICMDQLLADISHIPEAELGMPVTLIGREGEEEIRAEALAEQAETISNEILSRLGSRLKRIV